MERKSAYPIFCFVFSLSLPFFLSQITFCEKIPIHQSTSTKEIVQSIRGIGSSTRAELSSLINQRLEQTTVKSNCKDDLKKAIEISLFNNASPQDTIDLGFKICESIEQGAPRNYVVSLAEIGLTNPISIEQLGTAANSLRRLINANIDEGVCEEVISHGLYNNWSPKEIRGVTQALIDSFEAKLDVKEVSLSLTDAIDRRPETTKISREIETALNIVTEKTKKSRRRKTAYESMQQTIKKGVPEQICHEVYYHSIKNNWDEQITRVVFEALCRGDEIGLSPETVASSLVGKIKKDFSKKRVNTIISRELNRLKQEESERLVLLKEKPKIKERELNVRLMQYSIRSFVGTPYRWGGTTKKGIDCSGLVRRVYKEQGINLPHKSSLQFKMGQPIRKSELQYGDLIFFRKYRGGPINHVGIYIGDDKLVHAISGEGVITSSLEEPRFKVRYAGARRIVG